MTFVWPRCLRLSHTFFGCVSGDRSLAGDPDPKEHLGPALFHDKDFSIFRLVLFLQLHPVAEESIIDTEVWKLILPVLLFAASGIGSFPCQLHNAYTMAYKAYG